MITITDIAAKAGVSRATVSYVLNERNTSVKISDATRTRVLETANALGYRRNELARAVTTGKTRMLGFWVMQSNREPVVRIMAGAMKEADANGYIIKMLGFDNDVSDARILERSLEWRLAGIIGIHAPGEALHALYPKIEETRIPFVAVDSQRPPAGCLNVLADNSTGIKAVVQHLVALGHRRIAFLAGQQSECDFLSHEREATYRAAMQAHNLAEHCRVEYGDWRTDYSDWESDPTVQAARRLLDGAAPPTAVVCASDHIAMLVIRAAVERGLCVPQDLSVTGFDDISTAALYNPPLTTVAQPFEEMGRAAVRHLLKLPETSELLPTRLVVRGSTAPAGTSTL